MVDLETFEIDRSLPSFQARLAAEKKVNVYYIPGQDNSGNTRFAYVVCSAFLHDQFVNCVRDGDIPDYAVIVETGTGEPDETIKEKIKAYYGFDHDAAEHMQESS